VQFHLTEELNKVEAVVGDERELVFDDPLGQFPVRLAAQAEMIDMGCPRLPCTTTVGPAITQYAYDGQTSVNCSPSSGQITQGNPVQVQRWDSAASVYRTTTNAYNSYGDIDSTQNPRGFTTKFIHDSQSLFVIQKDVAVEDTINTRTFTYNHELYTGVLTSQTDSDHGVISNYCYDMFGRLVLAQEGASQVDLDSPSHAGCSVTSVRNTYTTYNDSARTIQDQSALNTYNDKALSKTTWYDQLGRVRQIQDWAGNLVQSDTFITTVSNTCSENATATYQLTSNPSLYPQSDSSTTAGWTRTKLDTLGRTIEVKHYSGSGLPPPWGGNCTITGAATYAYNANATTYTDEAYVSTSLNNSWVRSTNGLGQLTMVTENGIGATTTYGYDALNDLTSVTPAAGTGRSFTYTSLKQLQSATNPETGTISSTYDANGNLLTKTDGRGIVTTYCYNTQTTSNLSTVCYNGLDQLLGKSYSDSVSSTPTPWVG
jgi:YD repeat-containing protein